MTLLDLFPAYKIYDEFPSQSLQYQIELELFKTLKGDIDFKSNENIFLSIK